MGIGSFLSPPQFLVAQLLLLPLLHHLHHVAQKLTQFNSDSPFVMMLSFQSFQFLKPFFLSPNSAITFYVLAATFDALNYFTTKDLCDWWLYTVLFMPCNSSVWLWLVNWMVNLLFINNKTILSSFYISCQLLHSEVWVRSDFSRYYICPTVGSVLIDSVSLVSL